MRKKTINGREFFYDTAPPTGTAIKRRSAITEGTWACKKKMASKRSGLPAREHLCLRPFHTSPQDNEGDGLLRYPGFLLLEGGQKCHPCSCRCLGAIRSLPMDFVHMWYDGTYLVKEYPCDVSSQHISRLLDEIGNSSIADRFFSTFRSDVKLESSLFYDKTTNASYSTYRMFIYGHAKDHEDLPEISLSLVMEKRRYMSILFEIYPGTIVEVSTRAIKLDRIRNLVLAGIIILDPGFFSLNTSNSCTRMDT